MNNIKELEKKVWEMIAQHTANKDITALSSLNPIARDIEKLQNKFDNIVKQIAAVEEKLAMRGEEKPARAKRKPKSAASASKPEAKPDKK